MKRVVGSIFIIATCGTFVSLADSAKATITDVDILPEGPTVIDVITINVSGIESAGGVSIIDSDFQMDGTLLELDIFIDVGPFDVISPWSHSEIIGALPVNSYDLGVTAYYSGSHTGIDTYSTSFTVVPEPATFLLSVLGAVILRTRYRALSR